MIRQALADGPLTPDGLAHATGLPKPTVVYIAKGEIDAGRVKRYRTQHITYYELIVDDDLETSAQELYAALLGYAGGEDEIEAMARSGEIRRSRVGKAILSLGRAVEAV